MNKLRKLFLGSLAALAMAASSYAAPPNGFWSVNANGYSGTLYINVNGSGSVDGSGTVSGYLFNTANPIKGFWTESSGRLMFYRVYSGSLASTPPDQMQIYTAYAFPVAASNPKGSQRLAGQFEAFASTGATAAKNVFGWYATQ